VPKLDSNWWWTVKKREQKNEKHSRKSTGRKADTRPGFGKNWQKWKVIKIEKKCKKKEKRVRGWWYQECPD